MVTRRILSALDLVLQLYSCTVVVIIPWRNFSVPALYPALCPGTTDPNLGAAFLYLPLIYHTCLGTVKLGPDQNFGVTF